MDKLNAQELFDKFTNKYGMGFFDLYDKLIELNTCLLSVDKNSNQEDMISENTYPRYLNLEHALNHLIEELNSDDDVQKLLRLDPNGILTPDDSNSSLVFAFEELLISIKILNDSVITVSSGHEYDPEIIQEFRFIEFISNVNSEFEMARSKFVEITPIIQNVLKLKENEYSKKLMELK